MEINDFATLAKKKDLLKFLEQNKKDPLYAEVDDDYY